jgi:hydroxymethylbilane synthase
MLPCAGQGALGIETRADSAGLNARLGSMTHRPTLLAVSAERAVSRALGGNCSMPLAAHASWQGGVLELRAAVGHPEQTGAPLLRAFIAAPVGDDAAARALGSRVAEALIAAGAAAYLSASEATASASDAE